MTAMVRLSQLLDGAGFDQKKSWRGFHSHGGTPIAGWFGMENLIKMDDLGVPHFKNPPYGFGQ